MSWVAWNITDDRLLGALAAGERLGREPLGVGEAPVDQRPQSPRSSGMCQR